MKKIILFLAAVFCLGLTLKAEKTYKPSATYQFATRDTCVLYMDVYNPTPGSDLTFEGHQKPTILFVFGGGFIGGERSAERYLSWFKLLNDNGYRLVTIDYRLGLKGIALKFNLFHLLDSAKATKHAVDLGVEDVFSAVNYLCAHAKELGVDPKNIVLSGSSAGAMISLSSAYEISRKMESTKALPKDFQFAGLISFAGAIVTDLGKPAYIDEPCPHLLLHGTADETVQYNKTQLGKWGMFGSNVLAGIFREKGYNYNIIRYHQHAHDIADNFVPTWPEQKRFLEINVMKGERRRVDTWSDDPTVPSWEAATLGSLYD